MATRPLPCPTVLRLLLDYDPKTGEFVWKERAPLWFEDRGKHTGKRSANVWNARYAGKPALTATTANGYRVGRLFDNLVLAHRAAWVIVYGRWPNLVDHKNGDKLDNRISNLREATKAQNAYNSRSQANSSSQYKGVYRRETEKRWRAVISLPGRKSMSLGTFGTEQEAALAYNVAATRLYGDFARLNEVP